MYFCSLKLTCVTGIYNGKNTGLNTSYRAYDGSMGEAVDAVDWSWMGLWDWYDTCFIGVWLALALVTVMVSVCD